MSIGKFIICLALSYVYTVCALPASSQMLVTVHGSLRQNMSQCIADGSTPLSIRAVAICDKKMILAIKKGSKKRKLQILLDKVSPEIHLLIGQKNIEVRLTKLHTRKMFSGKKLSLSFLMIRGKDFYELWYGPPVWKKRAFSSKTLFSAGSGEAPGDKFTIRSKTFDYDFDLASPIL